jgi:Tfp pilus assembly protein PilF
LQGLERFEEAVASYDRALAAQPHYAEALSNRGNALYELQRFDEAVSSFDRALVERPHYAQALSNRGNALRGLRRFGEALESYDRAVALSPVHADALVNRGNMLKELRRIDEALDSYDRAIALQPDLADAHFNKALCELLRGDYDRGFTRYEWRWDCTQGRQTIRDFAQPLWLGAEDIAGKTILLHAEQGYGDTIQFCRYVPLVVARGARVILEVPKALRTLMETLAGPAQILSRGDPLPDFDLHCPLLSLPLAFRTWVETIPSATPYLQAPAKSAVEWRKRLGRKRRPAIGVAWSGLATHGNDRFRSMKLAALLPLFDTRATFVSVQKEVRAEDAVLLKSCGDVIHFGDELRDFADTAALIANLDLVIAVDTSVAHLAGALAKPLWVLLPFGSDWRWLLDRNDSPWYPTARLFRQDAERTWDDVVKQVRTALLRRLSSRGK